MIWIMIITIIACTDLLIKAYIEKYKELGSKGEMFGGKVIITKHHNRGAIFNIATAKSSVVIMISGILCVIATIIFLVTLTKKGHYFLKLSLSFLLGGSYSNTYDRLKRKYVVDYMQLRHPFFEKHGLQGVERVIFNIGDFGILIGTVMILSREFVQEIRKDLEKPIKKSVKKSVKKVKTDFKKEITYQKDRHQKMFK